MKLGSLLMLMNAWQMLTKYFQREKKYMAANLKFLKL